MMYAQTKYLGLSKNQVSWIFDDLSWLSPLIWPQLGGYGPSSAGLSISIKGARSQGRKSLLQASQWRDARMKGAH